MAETVMDPLTDLLAAVPDGIVQEVRIGIFWTVVVAEVGGHYRCGLASTLREGDHHTGEPAVREAGHLRAQNARDLAALARSTSMVEASVGMATINTLLPRLEERWIDLNAEEEIARRGAGKTVALVGHFPFVPLLRERVV